MVAGGEPPRAMERQENGGSRPVPDPTILTTQQLNREIAAMRDYIDGQISVGRERLDAIDKATELRLGTIDHIPARIDEKVETLKAVTIEHLSRFDQQLEDRTIWLEEKFVSIKQRFDERDTRSERESRDNKVAVDAAFAAQKEAASEQNKSNTLAIDKSEVAQKETVNKLAELFQTSTNGLGQQIADLKERQANQEANLQTFIASQAGQKQGGVDSRTLIAFAFAVVTGVLAIVGFALAFKPGL